MTDLLLNVFLAVVVIFGVLYWLLCMGLMVYDLYQGWRNGL